MAWFSAVCSYAVGGGVAYLHYTLPSQTSTLAAPTNRYVNAVPTHVTAGRRTVSKDTTGSCPLATPSMYTHTHLASRLGFIGYAVRATINQQHQPANQARPRWCWSSAVPPITPKACTLVACHLHAPSSSVAGHTANHCHCSPA